MVGGYFSIGGAIINLIKINSPPNNIIPSLYTTSIYIYALNTMYSYNMLCITLCILLVNMSVCTVVFYRK